MTLRIPAKVLLHVWSYDFYDMTLSTGKQRRHMIKNIRIYVYKQLRFSVIVSVEYKSANTNEMVVLFAFTERCSHFVHRGVTV